MASKRMFANQIIDRDDFCMLSIQSQLLYFHLGLKADDDGFVQTMKICRLLGFDETPLEELKKAGFIIGFEGEKAVVIAHWNLNNELKKDRYHPTVYQGLKNQLAIDENSVYYKVEADWNQSGNIMEPEHSVAQPSVEKPSGKSPAEESPEKGSPEGENLLPEQQKVADSIIAALKKRGHEVTSLEKATIQRLMKEKGIGKASDYAEGLLKSS